MPPIEVVEGDVFNSSSTDSELMGPYVKEAIARGERLNLTKVPTPLVELPLGATEDRVVGTIDVERALRTGPKRGEGDSTCSVVIIVELHLQVKKHSSRVSWPAPTVAFSMSTTSHF